jgi:type IV pilus assembly protein PilM
MSMFSWDKKQQLCGLQMWDTHARLITINGDGKQWKTDRRHTAELPRGSIQNGKIVHEAAVLQCLKTIVFDMELQGARVKLMIPTSNIILRRSIITSLNDQELRQLIEFELHHGDYKIPFAHAIFDFIRLGSLLTVKAETMKELDSLYNTIIRKHRPSQQEDVLVIATPHEIVKAYTQLVRQADLEPIYVEPALLSIYRGISRHWMNLSESIPQRFVVLHTDTCFSKMSIFDRGVPVFTLNLNASDYTSVEKYTNDIQLEFNRILNYFRLAVFSEPKDLRQLYLVGEADWIMKLHQPLGMMFDGNVTLLSLAELLQVNDAVYDPFTVLLEQGEKGA